MIYLQYTINLDSNVGKRYVSFNTVYDHRNLDSIILDVYSHGNKKNVTFLSDDSILLKVDIPGIVYKLFIPGYKIKSNPMKHNDQQKMLFMYKVYRAHNNL